MKSPTHTRARRHGAIAPLTAILMIPLLGMMAFSVDIGYMILTQTELQNTVDAAALAAAQTLMQPYSQYSIYGLTTTQKNTILGNATTNATTVAKSYASYNKAGGVSILLQDADVTYGFTDASGNYSSSLATNQFPNTVKVIARRDGTGGSQSNGALALFFAPVLNVSSVNLTATARATIYMGTLTSSIGSGDLLPVTIQQTVWDNFFANGAGKDTGNTATNGLPQLTVYPGGGGQSGNFGLLSLDGAKAPSQQNYSGTTGWIQGGPTTADVTSLTSSGDLPLPATSNWAVGPGLKSSLLGDFQAIENKPRILPLFDTAGGNGSNGWYNVVRFVGVTVTYAEGHGSNMTIDVQPSASVDPTNIITNPVPAGTGTGNSFVFTPPKLTY